MPTERELAEELEFSRGTIRKAYQSLHHRGLIYYQKRSYWVASDLGELELRYNQDERKNFAIFFHPKESDSMLLSTLEKFLRKKNYNALPFNLQSMDRESGNFDFMSYLHTEVAGAFFISSIYGSACLPLEKKMMLSLPVPYLFLATEPYFESHRTMGFHFEAMTGKILDVIERWNIERLEIIFPWPLKENHAMILSLLSRNVSIDRKVQFVDEAGKIELNSVENEKTLCVWFINPGQENIDGLVSKHLFVGGLPLGSMPSISLSYENWSKKGIAWLERTIDLNKKGQVIPACKPLQPQLNQNRKEK